MKNLQMLCYFFERVEKVWCFDFIEESCFALVEMTKMLGFGYFSI